MDTDDTTTPNPDPDPGPTQGPAPDHGAPSEGPAPDHGAPTQGPAPDPDHGDPAPEPERAPASDPEPPAEPQPRRLYRSRSDRVLGGVCGGLAAYLGIDAVIVRVVAVALTVAGGLGLALYVAALLLVPVEGHGDQPPRSPGRAATIAGVVVLGLALASLFHGFGWGLGGALGGFGVFLVLLAMAGLVVWWVASGERPAGGAPRDIARRAALGIGLLALCGVLAVVSFWVGASGGATAVAGIVIAAGVALVAGAFLGGARWLIAPALAVALPAGLAQAAGIDTSGGVGDRVYRPAAAADLRPEYHVGAGRVVVDLRSARLPAGDTRLKVRVGMGQGVVVVARDVCVATKGHAGAGVIGVFSDDHGGADVDVDDAPRAPAGTPRLVLDGDVGFGALQVRHTWPDRGHGRFGDDDSDQGTNAACGA
jgi:phage shock protein PspC (stress-responsive transcriptional regulator)